MTTPAEDYCTASQCDYRERCRVDNAAAFVVLGPAGTRPTPVPPLGAGAALPWDGASLDELARSIAKRGLSRVALLAVTRDDLADGGTSRLCELVRALKRESPRTAIELHVGDLRGPLNAWREVLHLTPALVHHWIAAAPRLYSRRLPGFDYVRSLEILRVAKEEFDRIRTRATLVVGWGETKDELVAALADLKSVRADEVLLTAAGDSAAGTAPAAEAIEKALTVGRRLGFERLERVELARSCAPRGADVKPERSSRP